MSKTLKPINQERAAEQAVLREVLQTIKNCCDREWSDETPSQIATICANAMLWRNDEIHRLRDRIAFLIRPLTDDEELASGGCLFRSDFDEIMQARMDSKP